MTASATGRSDWEETDSDGEEEVSAVMEVNDETGAFEYTLYSLTSPPYIRLYVPGTMPCHVNPLKCSGVRKLHLKVLNAIQV